MNKHFGSLRYNSAGIFGKGAWEGRMQVHDITYKQTGAVAPVCPPDRTDGSTEDSKAFIQRVNKVYSVDGL